MNIIVIPKMGMIAAAINTAIAYFVIVTLMYFISKKLYTVTYEIKRIIKLTFIGSVIFVLGSMISFESTVINILFKLINIIY